jgi:folate-binding protein YgfZ
MKIFPLEQRCIISISGSQRLDFLQGLITVDIYKLSPENSLWAGLLSPQGKGLFDFFIYNIKNNNEFLIDIHKIFADSFIEHLLKYKLRLDVTITKQSHYSVIAVWDNKENVTSNGFIWKDPRTEKMGLRILLNTNQYQEFLNHYAPNIVGENEYKQLRIENVITEPAEDLQDITYFWPEINAELLNGIDYKKGCYVGQEVTARLKHKTELKRQVVRIYALGNPYPPKIIATDIQEIGKLICFNTLTNEGLAYIYPERWKKSIETLRSVTVGDTIFKLIDCDLNQL